MILEKVSVGAIETNCYILASGKNAKAIIIDPGDHCRRIKEALDKYSLIPALVINTHGHYDHIGCDNEFAVPVYIHHKDAIYLREPGANLSLFFAGSFRVTAEIRELEDGELIELEGMRLKVLHTPGHTPGGISLLLEKPVNKIVFTGDTLFAQGIGRTDFAGGNEVQLKKSIREKLFTLADDTVIYPGHGPDSTIGEEKKQNHFLL